MTANQWVWSHALEDFEGDEELMLELGYRKPGSEFFVALDTGQESLIARELHTESPGSLDA